jgi:hypothetical protein
MKKSVITILAITLFLPQLAFANRLYTTGFEWQSVASGVEFVTNDGNLSVETTIKNSGAASIEVSGNILTTAIGGMTHTFDSSVTIYSRVYIYIDAQTDSADVVSYFDFYNAATNALSLSVARSGATYTAALYWNNWGNTSATTFTITPDAWHYLEIFYDTTPADGAEDITVRMDGTNKIVEGSCTLTQKTLTSFQLGIYNGTAGTVTDNIVYYDDVAINNSTNGANGTQTSYPGVGKIAIAVPAGAGSSNCTTGTWAMVNEIPPSDTLTTGSTMCELDANPTTGYFIVASSTTNGIDSYDTVTLLWLVARVREDTAGTSNWLMMVKSASGGTASSTTAVDAGDATTVRTNPSDTTAFGTSKYVYVDPNTGAAWTPTGTNSLDNMQIGVGTTDGTPDTWIATFAAMIEYVDGSAPPPATGKKDPGIIWFE